MEVNQFDCAWVKINETTYITVTSLALELNQLFLGSGGQFNVLRL